MALGDRVRELDEQVAAAVRRTIDDLRGEMRRRLDEATVDLQRRLGEVATELPQSFVSEEYLRQIAEEAAGPSGEALDAARAQGREEGREQGREEGREEARSEARRAAHGALRAALAEIDRARSQSDVLERLLDASAPHAARAAILLLRDGTLAGWGARGFGTGPQAARAVSLPADETPWSAVAGGGPPTGVPGARCAALVSQLDSALPKEGCLVPLVLRERVAAIVYADRPGEDDPLDVAALQVLTYAAALALETLAFREREATTTLMPAAGAGAAPAGVEAVETEPEPSGETEEAPELAVGEEEAVELEAVGVVEPEEVAEVDEVEPAQEASAEPESAAGWGEPETRPWSEPEGFEVTEEPAVEAGGLEEVEEIELEPEIELDVEDLEELEPIELAVEPEAEDARFEEFEESATPPHGDDLLTRRHDYRQEVEAADAQAAEPAGGDAGEVLDPGALDETDLEAARELEEAAPAAAGEPEALEEPERPSAPIPWRTETRDTTAVTPPPAREEAPAPEEEEPAAGEEEIEAPGELEGELEEDVEDRPEAGAVPPPPPKAAGGGAIEPPADVEGPGWAFSAAREPVAKHEEAAHEEARRLARLLVSEIQLYNQDEVEEGRRNRDVYERLKDDIDRSRQLYEERVDPGVRETTDYFYQELVRQLAAGDAKALGI